MSATLTSKRHTVHDLGDAIEFCFAQGWTDGLPVVRATRSAVGGTTGRPLVHDLGDAIEFCFAQGWTDGLPVVPPTADRVARMLEGARLDPKQEIGFVAHRAVSITAEKVAINAVMAGCKPEFMPLVVAAVEGIPDPRPSDTRP